MPYIRTPSQHMQALPAFPAAAFTNGTQHGSGSSILDLEQASGQGAPARRVELLLDLNPGSATTANFTVSESADGSTNWTTIATVTLGTAVSASTQWTQQVDIDPAKRKRYLRVDIIGTGTAGAASAVWLLINPEVMANALTNAAISV